MTLLSIPRTPLSAGPLRPVRRTVSPDQMLMDRQTFRDLEIFEADGEAASLFDLLNWTRTTGGEKVLRSRMQRPWSRREKIVAVQESLRHISTHRQAFDQLPTESFIGSVQAYIHSGLPLLTTRNSLELFLEAMEVRFGDYKQYWKVVQGIERSARFLRAMQRIAERPELQDMPGELGPLLAELRTLLARPAFARLPAEGKGRLWFWQTMRLDNLLRFDEITTLERLLKILFEIDAFVAMADTVRENGWTLPDVHDGPTEVVAEGIYHPFLDDAVPNAVRVDQEHRLLFLTGPNMAGKTTYLRACGTALYLAHLGMGVPARTFSFTPVENLFSAIALADNVREGVSFFRAEALRVKAIAQAVADGRRVAALLDEPFMGTNVKDAFDASRAVLSRFATRADSIFLVSSHLIELGEGLQAGGGVSCMRFEAAEQGGRLEFDYRLRSGISTQRLGVRVLEEEGVFDLLSRTPGV